MAGEFFVTGEKIVLKSNGIWFADGIEITHEQTRDLFFRIVHWKKSENQRPESFYLTLGYETIAIDVEDTAFFVKSVDFSKTRCTLTLTDESTVSLRPDDLEYRGAALYVNISASHGDKINPAYPWARFISAPYYDLLSRLEEDDDYYFIAIPGAKNRRANLLRKGSSH